MKVTFRKSTSTNTHYDAAAMATSTFAESSRIAAEQQVQQSTTNTRRMPPTRALSIIKDNNHAQRALTFFRGYAGLKELKSPRNRIGKIFMQAGALLKRAERGEHVTKEKLDIAISTLGLFNRRYHQGADFKRSSIETIYNVAYIIWPGVDNTAGPPSEMLQDFHWEVEKMNGQFCNQSSAGFFPTELSGLSPYSTSSTPPQISASWTPNPTAATFMPTLEDYGPMELETAYLALLHPFTTTPPESPQTPVAAVANTPDLDVPFEHNGVLLDDTDDWNDAIWWAPIAFENEHHAAALARAIIAPPATSITPPASPPAAAPCSLGCQHQ